MGRIRSIKPEFFLHYELFLLEQDTKLPIRIAFAGLWTCADKEGRFTWKPMMLKAQIIPYDEHNFETILEALASKGFIEKYSFEGKDYGSIPSWDQHQVINPREAISKLPSNPRVSVIAVTRQCNYTGEGKGREEERKDASAISPDMVMRGVISELCISGRELAATIGDVCKFEMKQGRDATQLRDEMISAYRDFSMGRPDMNYPVGDEKFFGQGYWKDRGKWTWKDGKSPNQQRPTTAAEKMRRAQ